MVLNPNPKADWDQQRELFKANHPNRNVSAKGGPKIMLVTSTAPKNCPNEVHPPCCCVNLLGVSFLTSLEPRPHTDWVGPTEIAGVVLATFCTIPHTATISDSIYSFVPHCRPTVPFAPHLHLICAPFAPHLRPQVGDHVLLRALKNKMDYCARHDIALYFSMTLLDRELTSFWAKYPAIRRVMISHPEIEWVWWMDSDAVFTGWGGLLL